MSVGLVCTCFNQISGMISLHMKAIPLCTRLSKPFSCRHWPPLSINMHVYIYRITQHARAPSHTPTHMHLLSRARARAGGRQGWPQATHGPGAHEPLHAQPRTAPRRVAGPRTPGHGHLLPWFGQRRRLRLLELQRLGPRHTRRRRSGNGSGDSRPAGLRGTEWGQQYGRRRQPAQQPGVARLWQRRACGPSRAVLACARGRALPPGQRQLRAGHMPFPPQDSGS